MSDRSSTVLHWPVAFMKLASRWSAWRTDELAGLPPSSSRSSAPKGRFCLTLAHDDDEIVPFENTANRGRAGTMTEPLAELTRLPPDHSHLRQRRFSDKAVELNGLTEEPSELVTPPRPIAL